MSVHCGRWARPGATSAKTVPIFSLRASSANVALSAARSLSVSKCFEKSLLGPDAAIAENPEKTNRWAMFLPAFATHVCLGAPYGWSAISASLAREHGFVTAAASDWALDSCTYPMSVMVTQTRMNDLARKFLSSLLVTDRSRRNFRCHSR